MVSVMKEFEHLKIHLEELKTATDNFGSKVIGTGGFGKVYGGEVLHSKGRSMVAIKRLSREFGQGDPEFWKEIMMLTRYTHKNLISLLGYCDQDGEKILVYEYASNGSLDRHLSSTALTWTQRLKICVDAARGLAYLHDHKGTQQRVLHRDIKSANILLDDSWNAKLSDMGLSKIGPANQQHTVLFTNVVGTPGYCDPQYMETYTLTKESDIYSFGVVLFEVLCGRLCFKYTNNQLQILVPLWKQNYKNKKLDQIIFKDLTPPIDPSSLETFSDIAFQCLHNSREQRPKMSLLVKKLEIALKLQERQDMKLANAAGTSGTSGFVNELNIVLSKGKGLFFNKSKMKKDEAKRKDTKGNGGVKGAAPPPVDAAGETRQKFIHFDGTTGYSYDDILRGEGEIIGRSTYGTQFKVTSEIGKRFSAIKLRENYIKIQEELEVEINLVAKISHLNLLTIKASFWHVEEVVLVYDYMPKGSIFTFFNGILDIFPHYGGPKTHVDWSTRMQIAKGVARGLLSLHTDHNIIHGNLSSHNVWLDENLNPKISDFGLSLSNTITKSMFPEYNAPELMSDDIVNTKTDVYSLGVIMLQLLTGKPPKRPINGLALPQWAMLMIEKKDGSNEVFDHELIKDSSTVNVDELVRSLRLALDCVGQSPQDRPDVQLVLQRLEEIRPETATSSMDDDGSA